MTQSRVPRDIPPYCITYWPYSLGNVPFTPRRLVAEMWWIWDMLSRPGREIR